MKKLNKIFDGITIGIFVLMIGVVIFQVLFRFVLRISVPWTEELSRLLFIYIGFWGTAIAVREKELIVIDLLIQRMPNKMQKVFKILIFILTFLFFAILLLGGIKVYGKVKNTYFATMDFVSNGWMYIALIIGMFMTLLSMVCSALENIKSEVKNS